MAAAGRGVPFVISFALLNQNPVREIKKSEYVQVTRADEVGSN